MASAINSVSTTPPFSFTAFLELFFAPESIAEAMTQAVIGWKKNGDIFGWNQAAEDLFGWKKEEIIGQKPFFALFPPTARRRIRALANQLFEARQPVSTLEENLSGNDGLLICEWQHILVRDEESSVLAVLSMARDITRQRRLEQERERLRSLAAAANASLKLDEILRIARDAIVEGGHFDRVGVFLVEDSFVRGYWGTDRAGKILDERDYCAPRQKWADVLEPLASGKRKFVMKTVPLGDLADERGDTIPWVALGLRAGGRTLGVICLDNLLTRRPILTEDLALLDAFVEQTAIAVRNATLLEERARHLERHRRLAALTAAISGSLALRDILRMVHDGVVEVCGFDRAGVFLYDKERQVLLGGWGTNKQGVAEEGINEDGSPDAIGIRKGSEVERMLRGELEYALYTDYTAQCQLTPNDSMYGVRAHALLPLTASGRIVGVLTVDNLFRDAPITGEDIEGLLPFAHHAAVAIQNHRRWEELQKSRQSLLLEEQIPYQQAASLHKMEMRNGKEESAISSRRQRAE